VSGSDQAEQELTRKLAAKGAKVFIGHDARQVQGADLVVYSTAVKKDNVEIQEAERLHIPVVHRSQMLARLLNEHTGIAVAGAHGKTTTSSMIALVMEQSGLDPTFVIGGEIMNVGSNAKAGKSEYVVAEADESDGSFLQYYPAIALVNNIEADHLEHYDGDFQKLKQAYARFLGQVREGGKAVVCADDPHLREIIPRIRSKVLTYAIDGEGDFTAKNIVLGDRRVSFDAYRRGDRLGTITLSVPGRHNVYNALAALITCMEVGLSFDQIASAITLFRGAKRRFQVLGEVDGVLVIDDYAHHPTEIQATISAAKATGKRIIAVFQPQRYTRTFFLLDAFSRAFHEADEVVITDIYSPAGEARIEGISSERLADMIRENSNEHVSYLPAREDVEKYLAARVESGDLVLTMGAGDIYKAAEELVRSLEIRKKRHA
jgi:UDP-N-acetylmuramate--alanine ligase